MSAIYESDKLLAEYLLFHFGTEDEILPPSRTWPAGMREALDFAKRTPAHFSNGTVKRGLDLGCAVGRSAFEMARTCDEVHAANLLCRLPEPKRLLDRLPALVNPGGELVLATPCTWLEEFTPPANWPVAGTFEWLQQSLTPDFTLVRRAEEPFLIRETARKFQWTTSLVTVWRREVQG